MAQNTPARTVFDHASLEDCRVLQAGLQGKAATVQARLPRGFMVNASYRPPAPPPGYGAPEHTYIVLDARRCAESTGPGGAKRDVTWGELFAIVDPPPDLASPNGSTYFRFEVFTSDDALLRALQQEGIDSHRGVLIDGPGPTTAQEDSGRASLDTDVGSYSLSYATASDVPHVRDFQAQSFALARDGLARWTFRTVLAQGGAGAGTAEPPAGWVHDFAAAYPEYPGEPFAAQTGGAFRDVSLSILPRPN